MIKVETVGTNKPEELVDRETGEVNKKKTCSFKS